MVLVSCYFTHVFECSSCDLAYLHDLVSDLKVQITARALATGLHLHSAFVKYFIQVAVMAFHRTPRDSILVLWLLVSFFFQFYSFVFEWPMSKIVMLALFCKTITIILVQQINQSTLFISWSLLLI
jgi:hypothetical protein